MCGSRFRLVLVSVLSALLSACGGGGGSSSSAPNSTTAAGVASKGPISKAKVTAYPVDSAGVVGTSKIAEGVTNSDGSYSLPLGSYVGCVDLVMTVAADTQMADEATGSPVTLPGNYKLHAATCVESATKASESVFVAITPYTEMAHEIAVKKGGLSKSNIDVANGFVFSLFGFAPTSTKPAPDGTGTEVEKRAALFNAAISHLANTSPTTTDPAALACFTDAGSDQGKKIQCATNQLATSVGTDGSIKVAVVGLATALSSASDSTGNKTGLKITPQDTLLRTLQGYDTKFASNETPPPLIPVDATARTNVVKAKDFFTALRSNANALRYDPTTTGLVDGVKAFGDSLKDDASLATKRLVDALTDSERAGSLWFKLKSGASTRTSYGDCYLDRETGPIFNDGIAGIYSIPSYLDTSSVDISNASRIICDVYDSYGFNNDPTTQVSTYYGYVRSFVYDFKGSANLSDVEYYSITRRLEYKYNYSNDTSSTSAENISTRYSGKASFVTASGDVSGVTLVGDFSPGVDGSSPPQLLAKKYGVDISGALTNEANNLRRLAISSGRISLFKFGEESASTTLDVSAGAKSFAMLPSQAAIDRFKATLRGARSGQLLGAAQRYEVAPPTVPGDFETVKVFTDWSDTVPEFTVGGKRNNVIAVAAGSPTDLELSVSKISLATSIRTTAGLLSGELLIDQLRPATDGSDLAGHVKLTGDISVVPVVNGVTGSSLVQFLKGSLDVTFGNSPKMLGFDGMLFIPNRPNAVLTLTAMEYPASNTASKKIDFSAKYMQGKVDTTITGSRTPYSYSFTFADSSGVTATVTKGVAKSKVTVGGSDTAEINTDEKQIVYKDGTFETLN